MYSGKIAVPPGGGGIRTLQDCTWKFSNSHLTFVAICIPIVSQGTLENFIISWTTIKNCFIFFQSAMDQAMTFSASLDSGKNTLPDYAWGTTCVYLKKKSWLSLATENNAKKNIFYGCFVAHEKPYPWFFVHWNRIINKKVTGWGVFHQTACIHTTKKILQYKLNKNDKNIGTSEELKLRISNSRFKKIGCKKYCG
jgi:hypothetical protein